MYKSSKLVQGIGTKGMTYPTKDNADNMECSRIYQLWLNMLTRCTQKCWDKYPTYTGVTCSENFKSYTYFYEWCQIQVGFKNKDEKGISWNLDKDLLVKGNKVYSEDTCVFVPLRLNLLLTNRESSRGEWPIGVYRSKNKKQFRSMCSNGTGKRKHLGYFNTPQEAFQAYKTYKEALIKQVANEYKEQLDCRVYEALMNYEVNEND